jgi:thiol-disulfide isomerase/thioredoxin
MTAVIAEEKPAATDKLPLDRLVGKRVGDFKLKDVRNGNEVWLYGLAMANKGIGNFLNIKKTNAVVFVFVSPGCPIGDKYLPRLNELAREYDAKGVKFFGIASNDGDTPEDLKAWAEQKELAFPVLHDARNVQADALFVERTNEVILADARATIRYRGAIDDQYGYTTTSPEPKHNYLKDAIEAVLAGNFQKLDVKGTEVAGCRLSRVQPEPSKLDGIERVRGVSDEIAEYLDKVDPAPEVGQVNYSEHVASILQNKCQNCHRPGQVGGFSLLSYDDARKRSGMIAEVVDSRRMPPWHADPRFGHFSNDRKLTGLERATLMAWVEQGTPLGDVAKMPPQKSFPEGWTIGTPDMVFELPESNVIPAQGTVPYYHITIDPGLKEDVWVQAAEARPGNPAVVHHIIVYVVPPGSDRGRTIGEGRGHLCGYAPGDMPSVYPLGTAKRVAAGSKFVFQMHYTPNGQQTSDRSKVGLIVSKVPPTREALTVGIANPGFQIPPGADDYPVKSEQKFRNEVRLLAFMPHMHLRGKSFKYTLQVPEKDPETLLSVPAYDFGWQSYYTLAEPLILKPGTVIKCDATFDNSDKNRANPDPKSIVRWGEQTWEEMMIGYVDIDFPIRKIDPGPGDKAADTARPATPKSAAD